jgi:hypothetical protein
LQTFECSFFLYPAFPFPAEFGGAKGEEEGAGKAKVVGVFDKVSTILDLENRHLDRSLLKVVDETLAEADRKVGREIGASLVSFREISIEEASEVGPSPRQRVSMCDGNGRR